MIRLSDKEMKAKAIEILSEMGVDSATIEKYRDKGEIPIATTATIQNCLNPVLL